MSSRSQGAVAAVQVGDDLSCGSFAVSRINAASRRAYFVSLARPAMELVQIAADSTKGDPVE